MIRYSFLHDVYLQVTPAGAYYAVCSPETQPTRGLLLSLLAQEKSPLLNTKALNRWKMFGVAKSGELLWNLQEAGWISGEHVPAMVSQGVLEDILPRLIGSLSRERKAFLADENGFLLSYNAFDPSTAEQLAAYCAQGLTMQERCGESMRALGLYSAALAMVDAGGVSQMGFWPLYIGGHRFALGIYGTPFFGQINFRDLIWYLTVRFR